MIIFEDGEYIAHYRQGSSSFVLVTFAGIRAQEAIDGTYFAEEPCDKLDITAVGLVAKSNSWYRAPGIQDALREMRSYTRAYEEVYAYGLSMGAYAAIKYSGFLRATHVIALAPQWSLDRRERTGRTTQFDAYYLDSMQAMGIRGHETAGRIHVVLDAGDVEDVIHAGFIAANVADTTMIPVFHAGHVVSNTIKGTANLQRMLSAIRVPSALSRAISEARRASAENQKSIIRAAIQRHPVLALRALRCERSRRSGACRSCLDDAPLVQSLMVSLLTGRHVSLARSLLHLSLYGILPGADGEGDLALCFTYAGEMLTYSPVADALAATKGLHPRGGFHPVLLSATDDAVSLGYRTMDGPVRFVTDGNWTDLRIERRPGCRHLLSRGSYLSTQPSGDVHANRTDAELWERFHLLPLPPGGDLQPPPDRRKAVLSRLATMRITAVGNGHNAIHNNGDHTFLENWTCEDDFDSIRLIYMVDSSDDDLGIGAASVAPASRLTNNPVDDRGGPVALRPVSFGGRGQAADLAYPTPEPEASSPVPTSLDLPAFPSLAPGRFAMVPRLYFSDWVPLASVPRTDGGAGRLVHVRTLIAAGRAMRGVTTSADGRGTPADPVALTGRSYQTCFLRGDFTNGDTVVPELDAVPPPAQGRGLVYGVQAMCRRHGATVQMVGDSIGSGHGSRTDHTGFAPLAASLVSTPSLPVCFLQSGTYAQPSFGFHRAAMQDLEAASVAVAVIQTWSGNDVHAAMSGAQAQVAADNAWHAALRYGDLVRRQGGVPIYLSAVPQKTKCVTPAQDAARLSSVARCAELARSGEFTIDLNAILGDGNSPTGYAPPLTNDEFHPNHAGHERVAAVLAPLLAAIIGSDSGSGRTRGA